MCPTEGDAGSNRPVPAEDAGGRVRRMALVAAILLVVQTAVGMVVNLYVTIPPKHPGAHPSNYLSGSLHSVGWAIANGALALAIHALLGLALVVAAVVVAVQALKSLRRRSIGALAVLAAALVIGAGFNGASFLDFNMNVSSLVMSLLALGALLCYLVEIYLLPGAT